VALLWEKSIGERSAWAPYVATLPMSVRAPRDSPRVFLHFFANACLLTRAPPCAAQLPAAALARSGAARSALNGTFAAEYLTHFWAVRHARAHKKCPVRAIIDSHFFTLFRAPHAGGGELLRGG
jgi:hypothetical protein